MDPHVVETLRTIYFILMFGGLGVFIVTLFLGGDHETGHEVHVEHEVGGHEIGGHELGHEVGHEVGHEAAHETGHAGHEGSHDGHAAAAVGAHAESDVSGSTDAPGKLSLRIITLCMMGIGSGGYIGLSYLSGWGWAHLIFAVIGLVITYKLGYAIAKFFYRQQSSTVLSMSDFIGDVGVVISRIPAASVGEVRVKDKDSGLESEFMAMSNSGEEIEAGAEVVVEKIHEGRVLLVDRRKKA